jgi:MFS superfamily sulfate permease-like transporter
MILNNTFKIPRDGLAGLRQYWRWDGLSALLVFVLALPFCLSVAFASHFPIVSGIITTVVGGLVITFVSKSHLSIKSPSLGLVPIVMFAVHNLGSGYLTTVYQYTLALIVLAGVLQMLWGLLRMGEWLGILSDAIVYGLLATIGITVFVHQLPFLLGIQPKTVDTLGILLDLPFQFWTIKPAVAFIGLLSLLILFSFSSIKSRFVPIFPTPMLVVLLGMILGFYFQLRNTLEAQYLIILPNSTQEIITFPNFERVFTLQSVYYIVVIAILGSLETMLNTKSVDAIDFYRRKTPTNREIFAIGLGNVISGSLGGLPMVSSLDFSSANVNSRAKTRWANFFHGLYVGLFLLVAVNFIEYIPSVVLSAILIYHAYKLFTPDLFKDILYVGKDQLLVFVATIVAGLAGGVLWGIVGGFLANLFVYWYLGASWRSLFWSNIKVVNFGNNRNKVTIKNEALATNYLDLKRQIAKLPKGGQIYLDFTKCKIIDYNFLELAYHHPYNYNTDEGSLELQGFEDHQTISKHPLASRILKKNAINPENIALFNERQLEVLAVAAINNAKLRPSLTYDGNRLQGFKFALGYEIKYRENKFAKNFKSRKYNQLTKMEFSDIFLSKGIRLSEQSHHVSILHLHNIPIYVPAFTLNREGIFAKLLHTVGYDDIDFEEYPEFSQHYFLRGFNEREIRKFFCRELLEFLEENRDFNIESSDNKIMIYRDLDLMNRIEIEDCIDFTEKFLKIIYQEEVPIGEQQTLEVS